MQKESTVEKITKKYLILKVFKDIALIYEDNPYVVGVANISKNEVILEPQYSYQCLDNNYLILEKDNEVTIYDINKQEFIINNYYRFYRNYVFNNPINYRYWLFDNKLDNLMGDFDLVKHIENNFNDYFIVYKGVMHGLYCIGKGLIEPVIYQNIYQVSGKLIFEMEDKSFYVNINNLEYQRSKDYENIKVINDYLYCYNKDYIDIIKYHSEDSVPRFDEVKYSNDNEYIVKNNNKYGIYDRVNQKMLLDIKYDDILKSKDDYLVRLNNKVGFYSKEYFIEPRYDNIVNEDFLYLNHQDLSDMAYKGKIYVKDCKIIDIDKDSVSFKKDDKFGLIVKTLDEVNVYENKDLIKKNREEFGIVYLLYQGEKQALIINGYKVIDYTNGKVNYQYNNKLYITVNNMLYLFSDKQLIEKGNYKEIVFFKDFIKVVNDLSVYLIDYENFKIISNLPINVQIQELDDKMYLINDCYYVFKDNKLLPLITKEYDLYKTIYTDEKTKISYEITSNNKDEYDNLCYQIDTNENANVLLSDMVEEESYKKDYSSIKLVRKIG